MTLRIAHLADCHLGHRRYHRTTSQGVNVRERDVATAFHCALDRVISLQPDLVVIAGDFFDSVRPPNSAIIEGYREITRLTQALSATPVILIAGNHDQPRSAEVGCMLRLFAEIPGVRVALEPTSFAFPDLHVRCLPESPRSIEIGLPSSTARYNVLVAHGETPAMAARWGDMRSHNTLDPACFVGWDYVALGDYHVARQVAANAWYAGALEYVSSNPWDELREEQERGHGKGFLLAQLADPAGAPPTVDFQPVRTRTFRDLPPIDATGLSAAEIMDRIAAQLPELQGAVVRQKVLNLAQETRQALNHEQLRAWKAQALHFQMDLRVAARQVVNDPMRVRKRQSTDELIADFFARRAFSPDIDRERITTLAQGLMAEATALEEARQ